MDNLETVKVKLSSDLKKFVEVNGNRSWPTTGQYYLNESWYGSNHIEHEFYIHVDKNNNVLTI